jgi:hypothetical protein
MKKINYGDFLVYSDSGIEIIEDLSVLFDICSKQNGIMLFQIHNQPNSKWTKRDCFVFMKCDSEKYWNAQQVNAAFQVYVKNDKAIAFLDEWLDYAKNPNITTDQSNICGLNNLQDFKEHRRDQSIFSNLAVKHNLEIFRDASQWGNSHKIPEFRKVGEFLANGRYENEIYYNSPYATLLNHHRRFGQATAFLKIKKFLVKSIIGINPRGRSE